MLRLSFLAIILLAALATAATPLRSQASPAGFEALRAADLRLATIGYRLVVANAALCGDRAHASGLVLHDIAEYEPAAREAARRHFGFATPIAVEAVVPGSAAAAAGVQPGDSLVSADGASLGLEFPTSSAKATTDRALLIDARLADASADGVLNLSLSRGGRSVAATLRPVAACRTRFELSLDRAFNAEADGAIVQIAVKLMEAFRSDDEAAFILAHELAHNVMRHRIRLDEAGVDRGMFEGFGRAVGYIRRTEVEADIVGIALAANAGYDPTAAAGFWRWFGPRHFDSIFMARTHPKWSTRAKLLDREAAVLATRSARPFRPPLLATANTPLSNDWPSLLAAR